MAPVNFNGKLSGLHAGVPTAGNRGRVAGKESFGSVLQEAGLKLSAHAMKRLDERNVTLGSEQQARLGAAVDRIKRKGADKSLVLLDDLALVVSARNGVVITALDSGRAKDGVFTNIDSAVIV